MTSESDKKVLEKTTTRYLSKDYFVVILFFVIILMKYELFRRMNKGFPLKFLNYSVDQTDYSLHIICCQIHLDLGTTFLASYTHS